MALFVLMAFAVFVPFVHFEVNDDIQMLTAASGSTTGGTGIPQLMFVSSLFGRLFVLLYEVTRNIEWYGVFMAIFTLAAVLALGHVLVAATAGNSARTRRIAIVGAIALLAGTLLTMQYTRVGILLAFAGTLLALSDNASAPGRQLGSRWYVLSGALLILLGFMCRFEAAALGLLLALPAAALVMRQPSEWRSTLRRVVLTAFVAGPLILAHMWLDQRAYATTGWADGLRYFQTIRPFADYHLHLKVCGTADCAHRSGVWSENDIQLLDDFIYVDSVVFSEKNIDGVATRLFPERTSATWRLATRLRPLARALQLDDANKSPATTGSGDLQNALREAPNIDGAVVAELDASQLPVAIVQRIFQGALAYPEFAIFCFMLALALQLSDRGKRLAILGYVGWVGLLLAAIYLFTKSPPPWVIRPLWLASATVLMIVALRDMRGDRYRAGERRLVAVVLTGLLLYIAIIGSKAILREAAYERSREEFLTKNLATGPLLVTSLASFPMESLWRPFGGNASVHAHRWLMLGWMTGTPVHSAQLRNTGISRPIFSATCGKESLFLGSEYHAKLFETFTRENGGGECRLTKVEATTLAPIWHGSQVN